MFVHYLKVAFRNLWKYKTQSLISIVGLSVALVCFSICFYVVRSVASADSSYPDSDRMFAVMADGRFAYMPLTGKLVKDAYPDVEDYVSIEFHQAYLFDVGDRDAARQYNLRLLESNPSFVDFFSLPVVSPLLPGYKEQINGIILFESAALFRNGLIGCQIFIGCFFFFVSLSLYKQFDFTRTKDKGLLVENITQIDMGFDNKIDANSLKSELIRSPHIEDITFTTLPVLSELGDYYQSYIASFSVGETEYDNVNVFVAEPNFAAFFGMKLKDGKWVSNENEIAMNETMFRTLGYDTPVAGESTIAFGNKEMRISGIIEDYNYSTMQYPIQGLIFHMPRADLDMNYQYAYMKIEPGHAAEARDYAKAVLAEMPLGKTGEDLIYSLVSLTLEQRRKEISIRKINGAEFLDILVLFVKEYFVMIVAGNVLALSTGFYFISRWLENYAYRTALSWWLFAVVFSVTIAIVMISVFRKIRIASKTNPAEALKEL